ncbi:MAG: hypothetical protein ACREAB_01360 [Blastocatellia bacterium]
MTGEDGLAITPVRVEQPLPLRRLALNQRERVDGQLREQVPGPRRIERRDDRAFSAVQSVSYGNNRKMTAGYNQQRSQMTSLTVSNTAGGDQIINNVYDYYLGGGNNSRIRKITDFVDSNYTTTHGYD